MSDKANGADYDPIGAAQTPADAVAAAAPIERSHNIMLHDYRPLSDPETAALGELKDIAKSFWAILKIIDGSTEGSTVFQSRELQQAGYRLEEALMWAEKSFYV